jgi:long-chain fatty acid transport protein
VASPADLFGVGAESQAQAGVSATTRAHAAYQNPAELAGLKAQQASFGWQRATFSLYHQNGARQTVGETLSAVQIGLALPVPLAAGFRERVGLGLSVVAPRGGVARASLLFPEVPQFALLAPRADSLNLWAGVGIQVTGALCIGVGLGMLAGLFGEVGVTSEDGRTATLVDNQLVLRTAPALGLSYQAFEGLSFGGVWRDALFSELEVGVVLDDLGSVQLPPLHLSGVAQYDPEQLAGDVSFAWPLGSVALGVVYRRWSEFPGWLGATVSCPIEAKECGSPAPKSPGYRDTVTPRVGAAYRLFRQSQVSLALRAGAAYEPTPVPEQTEASNTLDNSRVLLTAGYGVRIDSSDGPLEMAVAYQRHQLVQRTHRKGEGISEDNPGAPEVRTGGSIDVWVMSLQVTF